MEEFNNILSRYDAVTKQAVNFDIDAQRYFTVFDLKCQIALALGADLQDVKDCLSTYDVDYLIYKTYGGTFVTNTDKWKRGVNGIPSGWEVEIEGTSA